MDDAAGYLWQAQNQSSTRKDVGLSPDQETKCSQGHLNFGMGRNQTNKMGRNQTKNSTCGSGSRLQLVVE
jgi:hypothetical protein